MGRLNRLSTVYASLCLLGTAAGCGASSDEAALQEEPSQTQQAHDGMALDSVARVVADYDGDHKTDLTVRRPSQTKFYTIRSSDGQVAGGVVFGAATDRPVNGDFDGDGKADWALWRPSTGVWNILQSSTGTFVTRQWGTNGDIPMPPPQQ